MEIISLKLDEAMLHNIDNTIREHNFSTRTEFIRDAIREKLKELKREETIKEFLALKGTSKKKISDEDWEKMRENAFNQLIKEKKWD
ncbi:MAG: ribbon-helix-helix domain-containing protein [Candidatus Woesearchaeota archaeon]|jgi:Arc/MetJ-type ribon-helix-helix transcriptional regulator